MKKLSVIFAVITMISASAMATSSHNGPSKGGDSNATSISGAASKAEARSASTSKSKSSATGGAGGNATATGGNQTASGGYAAIGPMTFNFTAPAAGGGTGNGGGSGGGTSGNGTGGPATTYVQHDYSGVPNNTPSLGSNAFSIYNCDGAAGAQGVAPGFGLSFNVSVLRMMCEGRANAATHKALGNEDKARLTMKVVDEFACTQNSDWAKIARAEGLCKPEEKTASSAQPNPAFNSN